METTRPNPEWDPDEHEEAVAALREVGDDATIHVWGADWCGDCEAELPDFFAALDAAGIDDGNVHVHPVERNEAGEKVGDLVDEYDVTLIATIVVETDGEVVARFEEGADVPAAEAVARQLRERYLSAD